MRSRENESFLFLFYFFRGVVFAVMLGFKVIELGIRVISGFQLLFVEPMFCDHGKRVIVFFY